MRNYRTYCTLLDAIISSRSRSTSEEALHHLNGGASQALKSLVTNGEIKSAGAFFTSQGLAEKAVNQLSIESIQKGVLDPACGAGDLLISCSQKLDVYAKLSDTLDLWGEKIRGYDIHQEFVNTAKRRLVLCAINRGCKNDLEKIDYEAIFPKIHKANFLEIKRIEGGGAVVMNPPFNQIKSNIAFDFSTGQVSLAALFLDHYINIASKNQDFVAILPDVIRSGSRYEKLRKKVNSSSRIDSFEISGKFDKNVDIDVFILKGKTGREVNPDSSFGESNRNEHEETLRDISNVRVGSVVPHRDKFHGELVDYYTAKNIPLNNSYVEKRKISSTKFQPPLVAIRRTSSPSDKKRIVADVIKGTELIALENHLIAVMPLDGSLTTCKRILKQLNSPQTTDFINNEIRCRHLTVNAIKNIPIKS